MIFAGLLLFAVILAFFVSPLIAAIVFVVGAVLYLIIYGMSGRQEEHATADPGSHAARSGRQAARNTRVR